MAGEHGGMDQEEPPEDYREFRRMMDAAGSEGLRRMIERLTEQVRTNPHDTEALAARGLAYSELGNHRRAAEDNGSIIALDPDNADAHFERARAYSELGEHREAVEDYDAAIRLAPGDAVMHSAGARATPSWATWPGRSATSTWPFSWPPTMLKPGTTGG